MRNTTVKTIIVKNTYLIGGLVFGVMFLSACVSPAATGVVPTNAPQATTAPAVTQPTTVAPNPTTQPEAVLNISIDPVLGKILVGENSMTLYIFTNDTADTSNCNAECLKKWPPLFTQGNPILGDGVDASMVSLATLADGSKIVTYNHMPLYYWYMDLKAGDTNGQGVGGVWYVLGPDGIPVGLTNTNSNTNTNTNSNANTNVNTNTNTNDDDNSNSNHNSNDNSGNSHGGG